MLTIVCQPVLSSLRNIAFKAYVLNNSDRERDLGWLRRREKLAHQ